VLLAGATAVLLVAGAWKLDRYYAMPTTDWRRLAAALAESAQRDSVVMVTTLRDAKLVEFYLRWLDQPAERFKFRKLPRKKPGDALLKAFESDR
jgi:hypothetical protein